MSFLKRLARVSFIYFLCLSTALAEIPLELQKLVFTGNMHGRNSLNFRGNKNIAAVIPKGTEAKVLEARQLKSGSYGVKIKLTKLVGQSKAKVGDDLWVYYSDKDPWLSFEDKNGEEIQDPESALLARAKKDGEGLPVEGTVAKPSLPKKEKFKNQTYIPKTTTEAGSKCLTGNCTTKVLNETKNARDIRIALQGPNSTANPWANDPQIMKYSNSPQVESAISYAMKNRKPRTNGYCYRFVKKALLAGDIADSYPPGRWAREGVEDLKKQGMRNLMEDPRYKDLIKSPQDAPKGAVLIYENTKRPGVGAGHSEIKTGFGNEGGYISEFLRDSHRNLTNRRLIGVMIKDNL